jgi:plastocyanin
MKRLTAIAVPIAVLLLAGCGSSSSSTSSPSAPASSSSGAGASTSGSSSSSSGGASASSGSVVDATMQNLAFQPTVIHAKVGQTIKWTNNDTAPHNVTPTGGPKFTASSTLNPGGGTFEAKMTAAGTITYVCTIHPFMKGTIIVTQ